MFLEKMFGNTFGMIWLIIFSLAVLSLIIWLLVKKDKIIAKINAFKTEEKEVVKTFEVKVQDDAKEEVIAPVEEIKEEKKEEKNSVYEIVEVDGVFKVRKIGSERTIRKFSTRKEAVEYAQSFKNPLEFWDAVKNSQLSDISLQYDVKEGIVGLNMDADDTYYYELFKLGINL